jgi:hypothetical protein
MDRVSESLLNEFSNERQISHLEEDKRFEQFATFITVGQHYSDTFDPSDLLVGAATGIDGIATLINGNLITDVESVEDLDAVNELDVTFVFIQADRSPSFDASKIGNFGFAVMDFFKERPTLPMNDKVQAAANIMSAVYKRSSKFKRGNPTCRLYYATTGRWTDDSILDGRRKTVISDLENTTLFRDVRFTPLGAEGIQKLYANEECDLPRIHF